jgi:chromate transporter
MNMEQLPTRTISGETQPLYRPGFGEAFRFWLKLGFISFGGPTGQIAIMHNELVERRRWIGEAQFLHGLNFCMLLPGPEAQQLAIYIGWLLHRSLGGLVAGILFVLPSAFLLWLLSYVYVVHGSIPWISAIFEGLKPAVLAIVADAILRIGKRALKTPFLWGLSAVAFVAIFFLKVPFPVIIFGAGILGFAMQSTPWKYWVLAEGAGGHGTSTEVDLSPSRTYVGNRLARAIRVLLICCALWFGAILLAVATLGKEHTVVREGVFFSKAAMVTFGGAYAVLPYVAQQAVENYHWLAPHQMLDGLALAETTPGPLIMVVQFVGFLGAWNHPGVLSPLLAATLGAAITTWCTFVPCFLWIFLGAPYIESMRKSRALSGALTAITAAVVGVVLNLAVWFAGGVIVRDGRVVWFALIVAALAFFALKRLKIGVIPVIVASGLLGLLRLLLVA